MAISLVPDYLNGIKMLGCWHTSNTIFLVIPTLELKTFYEEYVDIQVQVRMKGCILGTDKRIITSRTFYP